MSKRGRVIPGVQGGLDLQAVTLGVVVETREGQIIASGFKTLGQANRWIKRLQIKKLEVTA